MSKKWFKIHNLTFVFFVTSVLVILSIMGLFSHYEKNIEKKEKLILLSNIYLFPTAAICVIRSIYLLFKAMRIKTLKDKELETLTKLEESSSEEETK